MTVRLDCNGYTYDANSFEGKLVLAIVLAINNTQGRCIEYDDFPEIHEDGGPRYNVRFYGALRQVQDVVTATLPQGIYSYDEQATLVTLMMRKVLCGSNPAIQSLTICEEMDLGKLLNKYELPPKISHVVIKTSVEGVPV